MDPHRQAGQRDSTPYMYTTAIVLMRITALSIYSQNSCSTFNIDPVWPAHLCTCVHTQCVDIYLILGVSTMCIAIYTRAYYPSHISQICLSQLPSMGHGIAKLTSSPSPSLCVSGPCTCIVFCTDWRGN